MKFYTVDIIRAKKREDSYICTNVQESCFIFPKIATDKIRSR